MAQDARTIHIPGGRSENRDLGEFPVDVQRGAAHTLARSLKTLAANCTITILAALELLLCTLAVLHTRQTEYYTNSLRERDLHQGPSVSSTPGYGQRLEEEKHSCCCCCEKEFGLLGGGGGERVLLRAFRLLSLIHAASKREDTARQHQHHHHRCHHYHSSSGNLVKKVRGCRQ